MNPVLSDTVGRGDVSLRPRALQLYLEHLASVFKRRDRVFAWLFVAQWVFALALALVLSHYGWAGKVRYTNLHVYYALFLGAALTIPPILMIRAWPGTTLTRHMAAATQMLWSALLIHLSGGRIETHFHVFGSLAFLAFYRDWKVLLTATVVVSVDHLLRGFYAPDSVYGIANPEWWRFLEHAFWVIFENIVLVMGIVESRREMKLIAERQSELELLNESVERKVDERTAELAASREQFRLLVETTKTIPSEIDQAELRFRYIGPQVQEILGVPVEECLAPSFLESHLHPDDREAVVRAIASIQGSDDCELEFRLRRADGRWIWVRMIASVAPELAADGAGMDRNGEGIILRGVMFDVTRARELEIQLRQSQKLESVGRLASGIAHEINTPVQFVSDSVHFVQGAVGDLVGIIRKYQAVEQPRPEDVAASEAFAAARAAEEEADLPYLVENIPKALERSVDGLDRVATLVRSMKRFAHPDLKEMSATDINEGIRNTLTIARSEYKYVADVETDLGALPSVLCHPGDLNQAVLNIIVNAAHAIESALGSSGNRGLITVRTREEDGFALIAISDSGGGIPLEVREQIFDPFFTTKEVGKGTGQGLAIVRSVVEEKHGGSVSFESELGRGTTFFIRIPIDGSGAKRAEAA